MGPRRDTVTFLRPDDWHVHLRDGMHLATTVPHTARCFKRAIVMPNLAAPITTVAMALAYRERIMAVMPRNTGFDPLMTLYLTEESHPMEMRHAARSEHVMGAKLYPAHATTNSAMGVREPQLIYDVLGAMEQTGLMLLVHGEVTDPAVDIFDREHVFIERHMDPLVQRFPGLRVVLEHITTKEAVDFVLSAPANVAATITPHHLLLNRNDMLVGGIRPHHYCLPVLKREPHRLALLGAATSGNPKFFLGTDSAPHVRSSKEAACGCAGIYSAHAAIELYAEAFDSCGALHRLEAFASHFGPDHYRLPRNKDHITLLRETWSVPRAYAFGEEEVIPMRADAEVAWRMADAHRTDSATLH